MDFFFFLVLRFVFFFFLFVFLFFFGLVFFLQNDSFVYVKALLPQMVYQTCQSF